MDLQGLGLTLLGTHFCHNSRAKAMRSWGVIHLNESVPLALGEACRGHLKHILAHGEGVEIHSELRLCAARGDISDHHLGRR